MTAKTKEKPTSDDQASVFVATHEAAYLEALAAACEAATTTLTMAWQAGYQRAMRLHRANVDDQTNAIEAEVEIIHREDTFKDCEKNIRDAAKGLADERVSHGAWRARTIGPYQATVDQCNSILQGAIRDAEQNEREQPLISLGLADEVRRLTDDWKSVAWNDETGVIEITDPQTGEVESG